MIQQAIASDDPIVFLEPKRRYWEKGPVELDAPLAEAYPLHASRVVRPGTRRDRAGVRPDGAHRAGRGHRRRGERPRPRGHRPALALPAGPAPGRTSRCGAPAGAWSCTRRPGNLGLGAEIAARITEECFYSLEAPVLRVTGFDTPYPAARVEEEYLPDLDRVLDAVDRTFGW